MKWFKKTTVNKISDLIKKESPNFEDLFSNMSDRNETHELYNRLVRKIHPDRYICTNNDKMVTRATELFNQLQANKTNLTILKQIETIIHLEFEEYEM